MNQDSYFRFVIPNRRFLAFGFAIAFASSVGQTSVIGVFGPSMQAEFDLSHTSWGTIYMLGTLASAVVLPWTGRYIDTIDLRIYVVLVAVLMIGSCLFSSLVAGTVTLALAIFFLRHSGQGLMSHTAITSMARYFHRGRGRAISVASLGFAVGESLVPVLAIIAIGAIGWRWAFGAAGLILAVFLIPISLWLLRGHGDRQRKHLKSVREAEADSGGTVRSWRRSEILKDYRFYLLIPGSQGPSFIHTTLFFHHLNIADSKGWTHGWITGNYLVCALFAVLTMLVTGRLVDRFGATKLTPFMLLPLGGALLILASFDTSSIVVLYLAVLGIAAGAQFPLLSAVWPELYGVRYIGSIKSMMSALAVFSSALGPVAMGAMMDGGLGVDLICYLFAGYCLLSGFLLYFALRQYRTHSEIELS